MLRVAGQAIDQIKQDRNRTNRKPSIVVSPAVFVVNFQLVGLQIIEAGGAGSMDLQKQIKPASAAPRSRPVQKGKEASPLLGGVPGGRPAQDVEQLPRLGIVVRLRLERLANFFIGPHWHTQCSDRCPPETGIQ